MKVAYSPCPNDTFIFHAWSHGLLANAPQIEVTHADIDVTNRWAESGEGNFDILKISYGALPYVLNQYQLLPCGGALGEGCGPLLLSSATGDSNLKKIAIPSERSTAYLLLRLWLAEQIDGQMYEFVVMPFHNIMPAIVRGEVGAGLVIHEARFTYSQYGLRLLRDLGEWWESSTGHLLPLGAIVAHRSHDAQAIAKNIRQSLQFAWRQPQRSRAYIEENAQELSAQVTDAHIALYVNQYSLDIGNQGKQSIQTLFTRAIEVGIVPAFALSSLWE